MHEYLSSTLARSKSATTTLQCLRKSIILAEYPPNTKLTEQMVCDAYGISRSTARQVIQQLENEGFLMMLNNGCKCIMEFTRDDLKSLYDLRQYYENEAIKTIFRSKTRMYSKIVDILSRLDELSVAEPDSVSFGETMALDVDFHRSIIEMSGNKYILKGYEMLAPTLHTLFEINVALRVDYFREFHQQHSTLIRSLLCDTKEECLQKFNEHHEGSTLKTIQALERITWDKKD